MKKIRESFRLNGLPYTLLKRNDVVALYRIGEPILMKYFIGKLIYYTYEKINMRNVKVYLLMDNLEGIVADVLLVRN